MLTLTPAQHAYHQSCGIEWAVRTILNSQWVIVESGFPTNNLADRWIAMNADRFPGQLIACHANPTKGLNSVLEQFAGHGWSIAFYGFQSVCMSHLNTQKRFWIFPTGTTLLYTGKRDAK